MKKIGYKKLHIDRFLFVLQPSFPNKPYYGAYLHIMCKKMHFFQNATQKFNMVSQMYSYVCNLYNSLTAVYVLFYKLL